MYLSSSIPKSFICIRNALNDAQGFSNATKQYPQTLQKHYHSFWKKDISVDIVTLNQDLTSYDLVMAPMLYMMSNETISKLENYVANGGTLVSSYISGLVNETDLAHLSGWPTSLKRIFGMGVKETDTLYPKDRNVLAYNGKQYEIKDYCTILEAKEAEVLGTYMEDFYQGNPAVVKNSYGKGKAYFIGARTEQAFLDDLYGDIQKEMNLQVENEIVHEDGVSVQRRESDEHCYLFVMNFTEQKQSITVKEPLYDLLTEEIKQEHIELLPYEVMVLKKEK
ncbi:beta-galactosidase trimerization domain-containing protein [Bacillus sp. T2.9-1]|uniref:beta-galactosidase trimerization domain-containing protein n=1 Tax=Bacillus sp. T2.9-1 TaxID=3041163 RepID=UPI0031450D49